MIDNMNSIRILGIIAGFTIIAMSLGILATAQPMSMPHVIFGTVLDGDGNGISGAAVSITNSRTGDILSVQTDSVGHYQVDLSTMANGYQAGDAIMVRAESGELTGTADVSVSTGPNDRCNVLLEEQTGTPFPAIATLTLLFVSMAIVVGYHNRR